MGYVALKPVKFQKQYYIGDVIPDEEIDSRMIANLVSMGLITDDGTQLHTGAKTVVTPTPAVEAAKEEGQEAAIEADEKPASAEKVSKEEEATVKTYGKHELSRMNKAALLGIAKGIGLDATSDMTNQQIAAAIIMLQSRI